MKKEEIVLKSLSKILALMCSLLILFSANVLYFEAVALTVAATEKVTATSTADKVTLTWKSVSKVTGYKVYQRVDGKWVGLKTLSETKYTVKNLTASESYKFAVRTYKKSGGKTYWSDVFKSVTIKTKKMGSTPTPTATAKETSVTLKWSKVAGATGYRVYQYKSGEWKNIKSVTTNTYTVKSLKSATTYKFRIKPYAKTSEKTYWGDVSKTCSVKTLAKDVTLVKAIDFGGSSGHTQPKSSTKFQSLFDFVNRELDVYRPSQKDLKFIQKFSGSKEDAKVIEEFVKLLGSGKMNLKECDPYYADYGTTVFASWGFTYTGSKKVTNNCTSNYSSKKVPCALSIYYKIDRNGMEGQVNWSASLSPEDLGFRTGNKTVSVAPVGKSAGAGLIKRASGKYETTDGRFSVKLNEGAMRVNGGASKKCTLEYEDAKYSDLLKIKNSNGSVVLRLFFSQSTEYYTGLIYDYEDVYIPNQYSGTPTGMKTDTPQIYQYVGSSWLTPTYVNSPYTDVTIRTVYYNAKEKVAVFYIYTSILDETEFFCAVDLSKAIDKTQSSGGGGSTVTPGLPSGSSTPCGICDGSGECTTCDGNRYLYSSASKKYDRICYGCTATGRCRFCGGDGRL